MIDKVLQDIIQTEMPRARVIEKVDVASDTSSHAEAQAPDLQSLVRKFTRPGQDAEAGAADADDESVATAEVEIGPAGSKSRRTLIVDKARKRIIGTSG